MATKIGDLYFDVTADTSSVGRALESVAFAAKAAAGVIAGALVGAGAAFNTEMQRTTALFSSLTGSIGVARDTMREFAGLGLDAPIFSPNVLARSAQTLLAFGAAADDASEWAQTINLAAEALNIGASGAHNLTYALGQVQSRGHLAGDEVRQLANYGINAWRLVAEATGQTVAEVRELGEQQKLLADDVLPILIEALDDTFGPAAQGLLQTFSVQARGLINIFKSLGSAIVEPFIGTFGGGALTSAVTDIRTAIRGLVEESDEGLFRLAGALEPFNDVLQAIAHEVQNVTTRFANWLAGATAGNGLQGFASGLMSFGSDVKSAFSGAGDLIRDVFSSLQPTFPAIRDFLGVAYDLARDAIPILADTIRELAELIGTLGPEVIDAGSAFITVFGPTLLAALDAVRASVELLADGFELIDRVAPAAAVAVGLLTAALVAMNAQVAIAAGFTGISALSLGVANLGIQATAARVAFAGAFPRLAAFTSAAIAAAPAVAALGAAILTVDGFVQGLRGNMDLVTRDLSLWDPRAWLQDLPADAGIAIGEFFGGVSEEELKARKEAADYLASIESEAAALLPTLSLGIETLEEFDAVLRAMDFEDPLLAGALRIAFKEQLVTEDELERARAAAEEVRRLREITRGGAPFAVTQGPGSNRLEPQIEEATELIKILEQEADDAKVALDEMFAPRASTFIDDLLAELPKLAEELTDALQMPEGAFRDVRIRQATESIRSQALGVIQGLVEDYGMSLQEIENMFNDQGLAGVIEYLGMITEETTRTVDPLIAKYGEVSDSVDLIRDAIRRLQDQRTTALRAQIDQVNAALREAERAADAAREAFEEFFTGGAGGFQGALDELVLAIPQLGDRIEEGLLRGGPQGEAMVRQALGGIGQNLGNIFRLGMEEGLGAQQIIDMLAPVYGSINQEVEGALNRITTLDWTEGFTSNTARQIQEWMAGVLDPGQIERLFAGISGADARVAGLQSQLDSLQAALRVDVEFSPEQVAAAIEEIQTETIVEPTISDEAAQLVLDEIQNVLNDEDLRLKIDQRNFVSQTLDAARQAEREITMVFDSALSFDTEALRNVANMVSEEFYAAFNNQLQELREQRARDAGFASVAEMQQALGPSVANAIVGPPRIDAPTTFNQEFNIHETGSPRETATEIVRASSVAAGSGGRYDPARWNRLAGMRME